MFDKQVTEWEDTGQEYNVSGVQYMHQKMSQRKIYCGVEITQTSYRFVRVNAQA